MADGKDQAHKFAKEVAAVVFDRELTTTEVKELKDPSNLRLKTVYGNRSVDKKLDHQIKKALQTGDPVDEKVGERARKAADAAFDLAVKTGKTKYAKAAGKLDQIKIENGKPGRNPTVGSRSKR